MKVQTEQGRACLAESEFILLTYIPRKALRQSEYHLRSHRSTTEQASSHESAVPDRNRKQYKTPQTPQGLSVQGSMA